MDPMDPSRDDQLAIWGTVLSQSTNSSGSERNHREFMTRQIERLNALGFIWTQDSIRDMFVQIASAPIEAEPFRLMDLPMKLITKIIDYVESNSNDELKKLTELELTNDHQHPKCKTSIASLASINRKFYHLCSPYLWRVITPGASDMWTDHIFPKHGHHVKDLELYLYDDSMPLSGEFSNSGVEYVRKHGISASKAIEFLARCPNIINLTFIYLNSDANKVSDRTEAYLAPIIPAIAGLKKLRLLEVESLNPPESSDFTPNLLEKIPPVETLICRNIPSAGPNHDAGALGLRLSQMKSLKQLALHNVRDVSEAWCEYPWQNHIVALELNHCGNCTMRTLHRIVHHIAPRTRVLKLDCKSMDDALGWEPQLRFSLPKLFYLALGSDVPNALSSFRDCQAITQLFFSPFTFDHYVTMDGIVRENALPKLEKIMTSLQPAKTEDAQVNTKNLLRDLKEFCDTRGIQTVFARVPLILEDRPGGESFFSFLKLMYLQ